MRNTFGRWAIMGFVLAALLLSPAIDIQNVARAASHAGTSGEVTDAINLVSEFEVNGLKVLLKRRAGSQTVVAALFLRGGSRNITEKNAGVEALMLDVATEAST